MGHAIEDTSPQYPVALQKAGYETFLVGKWHLKSQPKGYGKHMVVKGQGKYFNPKLAGSEGSWERDGCSTDVYTDIALEWLRDRDKRKPFLIYLHQGIDEIGGLSIELFDRQKDPQQTTNVANDPAYNDVLVELEQEMTAQIAKAEIAQNRLPGAE